MEQDEFGKKHKSSVRLNKEPLYESVEIVKLLKLLECLPPLPEIKEQLETSGMFSTFRRIEEDEYENLKQKILDYCQAGTFWLKFATSQNGGFIYLTFRLTVLLFFDFAPSEPTEKEPNVHFLYGANEIGRTTIQTVTLLLKDLCSAANDIVVDIDAFDRMCDEFNAWLRKKAEGVVA